MRSSLMKRSKCQHIVGLPAMTMFLLVVMPFVAFAQIPPPPDPPKLVNDYAELLTERQERDLEQRLLAHEDSTSNQIVIVTMPDLGGYEIAPFSYTLGDRWGVGTQDKDNGAVVTIAKQERKAFIATGRGLEGPLPDIICNRIVDRIMVPHFKDGNFYRGLLEGTDAMMRTIGGEYVKKAQEEPEGGGLPLWGIFAIVFIILFISWVSRNSDRGGQIFGGGWGGPIVIGHGGGSWGGGSSGGFGGSSGGFGGFGGGSFGGGGAGGSW